MSRTWSRWWKVVDATPATEATANTSEAVPQLTDSTTNLTQALCWSRTNTWSTANVTANAVELQTCTESNAFNWPTTVMTKATGTIKMPMVKTSKVLEASDGPKRLLPWWSTNSKVDWLNQMDRYYDWFWVSLWTNRYVEFNGNWYYVTEGNLLQGHKVTDEVSSIVIMVSKSKICCRLLLRSIANGN